MECNKIKQNSVYGKVVDEKGFVDGYNMTWILESEEGFITESFNNISLSDYEVLYGNNTSVIISVEMRLVNEHIRDCDNLLK